MLSPFLKIQIFSKQCDLYFIVYFMTPFCGKPLVCSCAKMNTEFCIVTFVDLFLYVASQRKQLLLVLDLVDEFVVAGTCLSLWASSTTATFFNSTAALLAFKKP